MRKLFLITGLILIFTGCDDEYNVATDPPYTHTLEHFGERGFMILHEGQGGNPPGGWTNKDIRELRTQDNYETELANYSTAKPVAVDFFKNQVLLIDMGIKGSVGGNFITVKSIEENETSAIVNIVFTVPMAGCPLDGALSNPYQFVLIAGTKPLEIQEEQMEYCGYP